MHNLILHAWKNVGVNPLTTESCELHMKVMSPPNIIWFYMTQQPKKGMGDFFEAGYVCGILCSQGSVVKDEKYGNYKISLETQDRELASEFQNVLESVIKKNVRFKEVERKSGGANAFLVYVYGKGEVETLGEWGVKRGVWKVPELALGNQEFRRGFLRGFFDAGGTTIRRVVEREGKKEKRRIIRVYSMNLAGLEQVKELLEFEQIKPLLYQTGKCFCLDIEGKLKTELFKRYVGSSLQWKNDCLEGLLLPLSVEKVKEGVNST